MSIGMKRNRGRSSVLFGGGAPVGLLAGGDVDHDGALEVLVSLADGTARVVDGLGTSTRRPREKRTASRRPSLRCGVLTPSNNSISLSRPAVSKECRWRATGPGVEVEVPAAAATVELVAVGWLAGSLAASDQHFISSNADADSDGVTVCGGDCDDENVDIAPGLPEA